MKNILLIEDDHRFARAVQDELRDRKFKVDWIQDVDQIPKKGKFDCAIIDLRLSKSTGIDAIPVVKAMYRMCRIVVVTGYGSIASAVACMKLGADDFVCKPLQIDHLVDVMRGAIEERDVEIHRPTISQVEKSYIDMVLLENHGNITKTAMQLGLHRQSLQRKLRKFSS